MITEMGNEVIIENIVSHIKMKCREFGLSINKMLFQAKLSAHLIDDWQNGRAEPSLTALQSIGNVLGIDPKEFFSDLPILTQAQSEIISQWRELNNEQKDALVLYIEAMKSRKN